MNIDTTMALVPFQGAIQPVTGVENKGIEYYGSRSRRRQEKILSVEYRPKKGNNTYGRLGKGLANHSPLGKNVDIYA